VPSVSHTGTLTKQPRKSKAMSEREWKVLGKGEPEPGEKEQRHDGREDDEAVLEIPRGIERDGDEPLADAPVPARLEGGGRGCQRVA
jgi:hypothetical protein